MHKTTGLTPFELVISRPPPPTFLKREPNPASLLEPRLERRRFAKKTRELAGVAAEHTAAVQELYKRDYDARIKPLNPPQPGDHVYVQRQAPSADADSVERRSHKLQAKSEGPYQVISSTDHTVTIDRNGLVDTITRARISKASTESLGNDATDTDHLSARTTSPVSRPS